MCIDGLAGSGIALQGVLGVVSEVWIGTSLKPCLGFWDDDRL